MLFLIFGVVVANPRKPVYTVVCRLLFLAFSVLAANPRKLLCTVVNPGRGLLNRDMYVCMHSNRLAL